MPAKGHLQIFVMVQNFFFPAGYLILVDFGDKFSFLHSVSDTGYPQCCTPGFGVFTCWSIFKEAEKIVNHIFAQFRIAAYVVKIRTVADIMADDYNKLVMSLWFLDDYSFASFYPIPDIYSSNHFFVNWITYMPNEDE